MPGKDLNYFVEFSFGEVCCAQQSWNGSVGAVCRTHGERSSGGRLLSDLLVRVDDSAWLLFLEVLPEGRPEASAGKQRSSRIPIPSPRPKASVSPPGESARQPARRAPIA
jgi:hypothetical protein